MEAEPDELKELIEILQAASDSYADDFIMSNGVEVKRDDAGNPIAVNRLTDIGDGLAQFIATELIETFTVGEPSVSAHAMRKAAEELDAVARAVEDYADAQRQAKRDQSKGAVPG